MPGDKDADIDAGLDAGVDTVPVTLPQTVLRGLSCACPRCGEGRLFTGFLNLRSACERCGLDYAFANSGDGPAVFIILLAGFVVVGSALAVEVVYQPPFWVHAALWVPLVLAVTVLPLRPMKGLMIALQYHHRAAEGRISVRERP